jgi:prophage regulatory protein
MQVRSNDSPTILRLPAVKSRTGWSRSSIYSLMAQGKFPKAVALGARAIGWNSVEIDQYIASLISTVSSK